jgi:hypothetical protein
MGFHLYVKILLAFRFQMLTEHPVEYLCYEMDLMSFSRKIYVKWIKKWLNC